MGDPLGWEALTQQEAEQDAAATFAATIRQKADLFVREGFRDDDGVWHDGPHRVGHTA